MAETQRLEPSTAQQRIESIDVLRGFAVLGILALNIQSFAMPSAAYMNPTAYGDLQGINYWTWYFTHLLGDLKFWSIFGMLFGAGIVLMTTRYEAKGRRVAGLHYRRMFWLLVIGLLHAHFIWYGDILYTYAMCGLVLYLFRKLPPRWLYVCSIIPLGFTTIVSLLTGWLLASGTAPEMRDELLVSWAPDAAHLQEEIDIYLGSWTQQLTLRVPTAFFFQTFLFIVHLGGRSAGLMLIGMALYKQGIFDASRSRNFYRSMFVIGMLVGLPLVATEIALHEANNWSIEYSFYLIPQLNFWGSIPVALGWVGLVMLVCKTPALQMVTQPLAAAGRMALTCYLLESLIATTLFYGHGLGWYGKVDRWQQLMVVVAIWVFLLIFATCWLRFFRYGPFEWMWRSLTYWKIQPLRTSSN